LVKPLGQRRRIIRSVALHRNRQDLQIERPFSACNRSANGSLSQDF
jgi:hypothetical protein